MPTRRRIEKREIEKVETDLFSFEFVSARKKTSPYLMVVLHGRGDSAKPFRDFADELELPEMNLLLLNAPRKYADGRSWYSFEKNKSKHVLEVRQRLHLLLEELLLQGWEADKIFLFGFSQGCLVACDFAMNYPRQLGGVIGVSGYFHFFPRWQSRLPKAARKTPWLVTHGRQDDVLSVDETREGICRLRKAGIPVRWMEMDKDHVIDESELPLMKGWIRNHMSNNH